MKGLQVLERRPVNFFSACKPRFHSVSQKRERRCFIPVVYIIMFVCVCLQDRVRVITWCLSLVMVMPRHCSTLV